MRQDDLTPAELTRRREELESGQRSAMARVDKLVRDQRDIGQELRDEMALLKERGSALEAGEADVAGLIPAVLRRFSKRREVLARRSVAEGLMEQYESVNISLRKATAYTAEELKDIERRLEALDGGAEDPLEAERERDRLQFQLRGGMLTLQLHEVSTDLNRKHLDPLRALRNTVLGLHEEMARYVLAATATVDNAGRRIQALGMAADAPAVIAELQESLVDLDQAMTATEAYVARANELLNRVLPELTDSLREHNSRENARLTDELYAIDRERARLLTDRSEQREALAEVESWFDE
jgi:hypothetical protein